jgi:predicted ATPase
VLATSREALNIAGETVWATQPLTLGDAVELFSERAAFADPSYERNPRAERAAVEICRRLDGLPLALELAAARARAFDVEAILGRLDDRFRLLTAGARTVLPRHQTLRAVVDWSYDLLFDDERRLFERLSVFTGPCSLEAAEAVCAADDLPTADVDEVLARLVDKSLVIGEKGPQGTRYRLLQTLAEYGRERLIATGSLDGVRAMHAAHYHAVAERGRQALRGRGQREWVVAVRADLDNFRAAIAWSVEHGEAQMAQALAGGLAWFWWVEGGVVDGFGWLEAALSLPGRVDPDTKATALARAAFLGMMAGQPEAYARRRDQALVAMEEAGPLTRAASAMLLADLAEGSGSPDDARTLYEDMERYLATLDDPWARAERLYATGQRLRLRGELANAEVKLADAARELTLLGDQINTAITLRFLANLTELTGQYDAAADALRAAHTTASELGFDGAATMLSSRLGAVAVLRGDLDEADQQLSEAVARTRELHYPITLAQSLTGLSQLRRRQGRLEEAIGAATEATVLYQSSGLGAGALAAMCEVGFAAEQGGDADRARHWHTQAFAEARRSGDRRAMAVAAIGLAGASIMSGEAAHAARLLGAAAATRAEIAQPEGPTERFDIDRIEVGVAGLLDPGALRTARAAGASLGLEALVSD